MFAIVLQTGLNKLLRLFAGHGFLIVRLGGLGMLMDHHAACLQAVTHVTIAFQPILAMHDCTIAVRSRACWPPICDWGCHDHFRPESFGTKIIY